MPYRAGVDPAGARRSYELSSFSPNLSMLSSGSYNLLHPDGLQENIQNIMFLCYKLHDMCPTLSVRVPDQLRKGMELLRDRVNWNEEIREFIRNKIEEEEKRALIGELRGRISELPRAPRGTAARMVREDRDGH